MGKEGAKISALDVKDLIKDLNKAYADEWLAHFSYLHMSRTVTGAGYEDMKEFLEDTAKDEAEHAGELVDRILELGGEPLVNMMELEKNANAPYPKPPKDTTDYKKIIKTVLDAEAGAIDVYNKIAAKTQGKDHVTYQLVCHILGEEVGHEEKFEDLLE
ncbi:MAG: ferritin-like domain-containing protein [Candidatus Omnitrophica bacterium]|nr:ferritin-like domain-containing protein [Candidatus Omnitrophota bacterium]HOX54263.1 ferritin-like domain-containing protein [Candidatus Omnitrophota bacterium]